jgi:hypothetical protein
MRPAIFRINPMHTLIGVSVIFGVVIVVIALLQSKQPRVAERTLQELHADVEANKANAAAVPPPPPASEYPHPIDAFTMRQACRNLIQTRWNNWDLEFQHADLEVPYKEGAITGWKSWVMRRDEPRWFICIHNAQTDWTEIIFERDSKDIRPFKGKHR